MHEDRKLYLVFEFLDVDLKKHMDSNPQLYQDQSMVKVPSSDLMLVAISVAQTGLRSISPLLLTSAAVPVPDAARDSLLPLPPVSFVLACRQLPRHAVRIGPPATATCDPVCCGADAVLLQHPASRHEAPEFADRPRHQHHEAG